MTAIQKAMPEQPAWSTQWNNEHDAYSKALEGIATELWYATKDAGASYHDFDRYSQSIGLIRKADFISDIDMLFAYGDWLPRFADLTPVQHVVEILRKHNTGEVRHLITEDRIESSDLIYKALLQRSRNNWENNRACIYLTFNDPSLTPKIVMLVEQGMFRFEDIRDRLEVIKDFPLPIAGGAL